MTDQANAENRPETAGVASGAPGSAADDKIDPFIFLDYRSQAYRVQESGGQAWLFYWHADRKWVSLREIKDECEIDQMKALALSPEQAALYDPQSVEPS